MMRTRIGLPAALVVVVLTAVAGRLVMAPTTSAGRAHDGAASPGSTPTTAGPAASTIDGGPIGPVATTRPEDPDGREPSDEPSPSSTAPPADGQPDAGPGRAGRERLPGWGNVPAPPPSVEPIGVLDDEGPVPPGLGLVAPPAQDGPGSPHGGPGGLAVAPSCSHQCISRGVAYPRGFGAEIVVETTVPAQLFLTVVADLDGDGSYEGLEVDSTLHGITAHHWALDHLEPGQTYHVMAAATDGDGHTAHVWGDFTTLSQRDVVAVFGDGEVVGGPADITHTRLFLGLDGPLANVTPGEGGIPLYADVPRHVDADLWMLRSWSDDLCGAWTFEGAPPYGHDTGSCVTWSSTHLDAVDLDTVPAGAAHWTETSFTVVLASGSEAGGALPPNFGDPYLFTFELPMTLVVTYS